MEFPRIPPNFDSALDTTRELRDFYMAQVREYERLLEQARSQLFHAEALLSGLSKLQPEANRDDRISVAITPQQAPIGNGYGNGNGNGNGHNAANYAQQPLSTEQNFASSNGVNSISTVIASVLNSQREAESSVDSDVQLLSLYQDLTLPNAIADLLQENAGTILKLDFIVRSLYGKLPASQLDTVTERVKQALESGVEEGRWQRDALNHPDNSDCYTWNLPLEVELTPSVQTQSTELSDSDDTNAEEPYYFDDYISKTDLLDLVDTGALTVEKMRQIAQDLHLFGYGSIKYPKSFAAFLAKNSVSRSVIQQYL